jgi:hypothetical protein
MTNTTIAWGWLATGVLALGVNGFMHDEGADLARRVADRLSSTNVVVALASGHADWLPSRTRVAAVRAQSCPLSATIARIESRIGGNRTEFARIEAMSAREQAALARIEADRARIEAQAVRVQLATANFDVSGLQQLNAMRIPVACPRVRVKVPQVTVRIPQPMVHVKTLGEDSI